MRMAILRVVGFLAIIAVVVALDQWIKWEVIHGFRWSSHAISIVLVYNEGVAFSMFAFLQEWLKWLQISLLVGLVGYLYMCASVFRRYWLGFGCIIGGGVGNVIDRFLHGRVVDYVYWHYGFEFAIFNLADVCINIGVGVLIVLWLICERHSKAHRH